jgi:hypothetical protein
MMEFVLFYAFNFYSRTNTMEFYDEMLSRAMERELGRLIDNGNPIQIVDHHVRTTINPMYAS